MPSNLLISRYKSLYNFACVFMPVPVLTERGHNVLDLSVHLSVCSFVRYQTCVHDILKTNQPNLLQIGTGDGPRERE